MKKSNPQPAKVSYFFGPGWKDLGNFIKTFWRLNADSIAVRKDKFESGKGIMSFRGAAALASCLSLILFGTAAFLLISATVSVGLGLVFLIVYFIIFVAWAIDRLYLFFNGIFGACPECKRKYLIPTYICPTCGAKHTWLVPGKYGVFQRRCQCGTKIPSHFLTGRGKLEAECPYCGHKLTGGESVPLYIPVVGGRSAGKTAFITAFSYQFIENVAPRKGLNISHFSPETENFYRNEICADYKNGTTRMTLTEANINAASSKAFSFLVDSSKLQPKRLIRLYDVDGESFVNNTENEMQLQYGYSQGIVLIIDPLTIPTVRNALDSTANETDRKSVGTLSTDLVVDAFMNKLREITGEKSTDVLQIPLAVVLSKMDMKGMEQFYGEDAVMEALEAQSLEMDRFSDMEDHLLRKFLQENGMANLVKSIDMKFKNNRFFACSAIGHVREGGKYNPKGVLEPMEWIFSVADSGMRSAWSEQKFGKIIS